MTAKCGCGNPELPFVNHAPGLCTGWGYTAEEERERNARRIVLGKPRLPLNPPPAPVLTFECWRAEMVARIDALANAVWSGKTLADHRKMEAARDAAVEFVGERIV